MPSRFGGTKSRNGCVRCKQRRVKCNETAPCNNCTRRREHCSLVDTEASQHETSHSSGPPAKTLDRFGPQNSSATTPIPPSFGSATWAFDLHLMNYFTTHTVQTLSSYPSLIDAWQTTIIKDAVSQPFLMHGILALAALHLASKPQHANDSPQNEFAVNGYVRAFRYHQNEAMPEYLSILQSLELVTNDEFSTRSRKPWPAGPVYAMAFLTGFSASASVSDNSLLLDLEPGVQCEEIQAAAATSATPSSTHSLSSKSNDAVRLNDIFDRLMSIFVATRGARVIVKAALEEGRLQGTAYLHLINPSTIMDHLPARSSNSQIPKWYATLKTECLDDFVYDSAARSSERHVCAEALACLQEVHEGAARSLDFKKERFWHSQENHTSRYELSWCLKWTAIVSQEFLALVHERHPAALIILAQFVAICGLVEDEWYMEKWLDNAIAAIRHKLDSAKALEWVDRIVQRRGGAQTNPGGS